jgi:hypothetical protein
VSSMAAEGVVNCCGWHGMQGISGRLYAHQPALAVPGGCLRRAVKAARNDRGVLDACT